MQRRQRIEIVDTVYLIAYLNPDDRLHEHALTVIENMPSWRRVSQAALIELDLLMKSRGFTLEERMDTWSLLATLIPREHVEPLLPSDFALATVLVHDRKLDYFDALIAAQCINRGGKPLTTDMEIIKVVEEYLGGG
ncbi:hypothetical protein Pyrfu_1763 [Pyrolobus fumarii 1A]|uniref:PIN domain-containing protein n=1 Tax=Pyrolobus fumarii (strain DSM 11204 / 1A) TaxID=694429 RepID=G0ECP7_PYRF1|nr:PIN domain-containing protein [Pyrolobus fumarii]AEM39617.1 hypothetical protein Pyrfu_1763 [Pyrolobus fumarii 1A]